MTRTTIALIAALTLAGATLAAAQAEPGLSSTDRLVRAQEAQARAIEAQTRAIERLTRAVERAAK